MLEPSLERERRTDLLEEKGQRWALRIIDQLQTCLFFENLFQSLRENTFLLSIICHWQQKDDGIYQKHQKSRTGSLWTSFPVKVVCAVLCIYVWTIYMYTWVLLTCFGCLTYKICMMSLVWLYLPLWLSCCRDTHFCPQQLDWSINHLSSKPLIIYALLCLQEYKYWKICWCKVWWSWQKKFGMEHF